MEFFDRFHRQLFLFNRGFKQSQAFFVVTNTAIPLVDGRMGLKNIGTSDKALFEKSLRHNLPGFFVREGDVNQN